MGKIKRTTVVLTRKSQEIKDRLCPGLGVKGPLSVGLAMFDALSDTEKIKRVAEACAADQADKIVLAAQDDVVKQQRKPGRPRKVATG